MIEANRARFIWLNTRNEDLMSECQARLESLIEKKDESFANWIWTEYFEVTFNNKHEEIMLLKYLEDLGYKVELDYGSDENKDAANLTLKIRIGI